MRVNFKVNFSNMRKRLRASRRDVSTIMKNREAVDNVVDRLQTRQENRWIRNFNTQGAEYGTSWQDITTGTMLFRDNPSGPPLQDTGSSAGQLKGFMSSNASPFGDIGIEWDFDPSKGSSAFPLPFHHVGFTTHNAYGIKGRVADVPARPIWALDSKDSDNAFRLFSRWAHDEIRKLSILS